MGCCLSSHEGSPSKKHQHFPELAAAPLAEEETVKEVLSVTPNSKLPPAGNAKEEEEDQKKNNAAVSKPESPFRSSARAAVSKPKNGGIDPEDEHEENEVPSPEISQVSDLCSLSESVSTAFTEGGEVRPRTEMPPSKSSGNRSFPREIPARKGSVANRPVPKSPAKRRSEPSPGRAGSTQGFVRETSKSGQLPGRRDGSGRREPGEVSGRRSRSPAAGRANAGSRAVGRSPSARKTGRSPCRTPPNAVGSTSVSARSCRRVEEIREKQWPAAAEPAANESLENPLVSLECFIFL